MSDDDIRGHFRLMRELGFTALKQCQTCRGTDVRRVMHMAMDEGIIPFWFGEAGWEDPTPEHLESLGIDRDMPIEKLRENETWLERQERLMRERIDRVGTPVKDQPLPPGVTVPPMPGVALSFDNQLGDEHVPLFIDWLKNQYVDIESLNQAWNLHHCMIDGPGGTEGTMPGQPAGWSSWDALADDVQRACNEDLKEFRRNRDVLRFKADLYLDHVRARVSRARAIDPDAPQRAGGEMGLFLPFASRGTDMAGIAEVMTEHGSFYPSIHLAWHFEETGFEYLRPMYMQASIAADWFKGGWSATWESTGGPQQLTGFDAPFVPAMKDQVPGFTVDENVMTQLMFSWIAGGFRGFGLWSWNVRTAGWEAGEYGLLDRNDRPTGRARAAGRIGQACRRYRDELWQADKQPTVGIFVDWDNEAIWASVSRCSRSMLAGQAVRARIGTARALIDANIPFEHVTADDLRSGLAKRYPVLHLPAVLAIASDLWPIFNEYVQDGGRLVLEAPGGWFDTFGRLLDTDDGSDFEQLFGCRIADFQYSRDSNRQWSIDSRPINGSIAELQPTSCSTLATFDSGEPAVTVNHHGQGAAVMLAYEASAHCLKPNPTAQTDLVAQLLGGLTTPFTCTNAIAYRLVTPAAEHYFLLNDSAEPITASMDCRDSRCADWCDAITDEPLRQQSISILPHTGRWVRRGF
jgi:beta-galactosidase